VVNLKDFSPAPLCRMATQRDMERLWEETLNPEELERLRAERAAWEETLNPTGIVEEPVRQPGREAHQHVRPEDFEVLVDICTRYGSGGQGWTYGERWPPR